MTQQAYAGSAPNLRSWGMAVTAVWGFLVPTRTWISSVTHMTLSTTLLLLALMGCWVLGLRCYVSGGAVQADDGMPRAVVMITAAALFSGAVALVGAVFVNMGIGAMLAARTGATAIFISAVGEEILKAIAALTVMVLVQQHRPRQMVRLAALVGLGFASAEAILYIWQFGADVLWVRMLWTAPAHMAYTVICVCGLLAWQRGARTVVVLAVGWSFIAHAGTNLFMLQEAPGAALGALCLFAFSLVWAHLLLQQAAPVVFGRKVSFAIA